MPFKANQDRRHRIPKQRHRVTNWAAPAAALAACAACAACAPARERTALRCRAADGRAFEAVIDRDFRAVTFRPLGGMEVLVLRVDRQEGGGYALSDGRGAVASLERGLGAAAVSRPDAAAGAYRCDRVPPPPPPERFF